ncbi:MAG TPA: hypothetical protein VN969_02835 [Streptosporangiaceae bacterium]|nr:hypothetical protein [Streptosporangiaceae bacterium]
MNKKVRWIITAVVAVLLIVALKTAGVFIDFFVAFCYGGVRLGFYIFRSGTRGIARIHAEESGQARPAAPGGIRAAAVSGIAAAAMRCLRMAAAVVTLTAVSYGTAQAAHAAPVAPAAQAAPALAGTWTGSYICSQGDTGLRLVIRAHGAALTATFSFYALPRNPGVPSGEYTMTGTHSATRTVLKPGHWIKEPVGYEMVGLTAGPLADHGKVLRGRITNPACSTFSVTRSLR